MTTEYAVIDALEQRQVREALIRTLALIDARVEEC